MGRRALAFFASVCLLSGQASAADEKGSSLTVGGVAPPICSFTASPHTLNSDNMSLSGASTSSGLIFIEKLIDETTGQLKKASIAIEIAGLCNQPHYLSLLTTKGGLTPETETNVVSGNFIKHVNYRARVDWAGNTATLDTDAIAGKKTSSGRIGGPHRGPLNINITIDETNNDLTLPTLVGTYSDSLIVQIGLPL